MTISETNAAPAADAQAPAAAPAAPAAPSKMDKAKILFTGLKDGSIAPIEGKSARATFIATMQEPEYGMTASGASTYWQNLVSKDRGGKLYPHTASKKKVEDSTADAPKPADEVETEAEAETTGAKVDEPAADAAEDDLSHLEG